MTPNLPLTPITYISPVPWRGRLRRSPTFPNGLDSVRTFVGDRPHVCRCCAGSSGRRRSRCRAACRAEKANTHLDRGPRRTGSGPLVLGWLPCSNEKLGERGPGRHLISLLRISSGSDGDAVDGSDDELRHRLGSDPIRQNSPISLVSDRLREHRHQAPLECLDVVPDGVVVGGRRKCVQVARQMMPILIEEAVEHPDRPDEVLDGVGVTVGEFGDSRRDECSRHIHHGFSDELIFRTEVVGDRSEVLAGGVSDCPRCCGLWAVGSEEFSGCVEEMVAN